MEQWERDRASVLASAREGVSRMFDVVAQAAASSIVGAVATTAALVAMEIRESSYRRRNDGVRPRGGMGRAPTA